MFMELTVYDARGVKRGRVQIELIFGATSGPKQWVLQEVIEGDGWSHVSASNPSQGTFEVKDNGVIWLMEPGPGKPRTLVIIHEAPKFEGDTTKSTGHARIYEPKDSAYKDCTIRWQTPGLSPVRKRVLELIAKNFPAFPGNLPIPNVIDSSKSYSGGVTNCGILPGWIARQLGYYLPWEGKYKNWKFRKQEYLHEIPRSEIFGSGNDQQAATSPLAAGWGDYSPWGGLEGYPKRLEKARNLAEGTIWVAYNGGKLNKNKRPQPGDFYVLMKDFSGHFAHVGVIIDSIGKEWRTADCGQAGKNAAAYKRRMFDENAGTLILNPPETNIPDAGTRWLQGWVNIDNLFSGWQP